MWSLTLSFQTGLRSQCQWLILRACNPCWLLIVLSFLLRNVTAKRLLLCGFFLHAGDKIRDTNNLQGARLILFSFQGFTTWGSSHKKNGGRTDSGQEMHFKDTSLEIYVFHVPTISSIDYSLTYPVSLVPRMIGKQSLDQHPQSQHPTQPTNSRCASSSTKPGTALKSKTICLLLKLQIL